MQHVFYSKFFIIQFIKFKRTNAKGKIWNKTLSLRFSKWNFLSFKFTKEMKCWSQQSKVSSIQHSKMKIISSNSNDAFLTTINIEIKYDNKIVLLNIVTLNYNDFLDSFEIPSQADSWTVRLDLSHESLWPYLIPATSRKLWPNVSIIFSELEELRHMWHMICCFSSMVSVESPQDGVQWIIWYHSDCIYMPWLSILSSWKCNQTAYFIRICNI